MKICVNKVARKVSIEDHGEESHDYMSIKNTKTRQLLETVVLLLIRLATYMVVQHMRHMQ